MNKVFLWPVGLAAFSLGVGWAADPAPQNPAVRKDSILKRFTEEFVPLTPGAGNFPASFIMGSGKDAPAAEAVDVWPRSTDRLQGDDPEGSVPPQGDR